ncbi:MAG TPA: hypothetical protein VFW11_24575 [Cyclobacteriaceae bacterium]|nr:hypothetical protein [Cyclobacteriaceae bacterium]
MKTSLLIMLTLISLPAIGQYNFRNSVNAEMNSTVSNLNAINIANSGKAYEVALAPIYTIFRSGYYGFGYWQGLAFTKISPDKFFESTYFYDMQGNLRETRSYFNIKRKGQVTNWSILMPTYRGSPAFVHTF